MPDPRLIALGVKFDTLEEHAETELNLILHDRPLTSTFQFVVRVYV
jgi:hypothetical protein